MGLISEKTSFVCRPNEWAERGTSSYSAMGNFLQESSEDSIKVFSSWIFRDTFFKDINHGYRAFNMV